jgi:hypothetical protein
MRYRLRTLVIVLAIGPLLLVAIYAICEELYRDWLEAYDQEAFKRLP